MAVIVESHRDARACRDALAAAGVPAVYTGDTDVFASQAAADWQCLLEAFEQPGRSGLVRAAATTMFFGRTAAELAPPTPDSLTDTVAETLRRWADHARARGIAAVLEAAYVAGMAERVLAWRGGERHLTDVEHLTQLLHEVAHRDGLGLPALLQWLRNQREERAGAAERNRRLDSDAARGPDHDRLGEQGAAVPARLPALRLQPERPDGRGGALPRARRHPLPRHRRLGRSGLLRR